jgi:hypothetical protein
MNNKPKQTAVEWLFTKLESLRSELNYNLIDFNMYKIEKQRIYIQAKEMEKEQICIAYLDGKASELKENSMEEYKSPLTYYNETYGKETDNN